MNKFEKLFTPFRIGSMKVKNRIVMSPMGTNTSFTDGRLTNDEIAYFERRAKGGVGMITTGVQFLTKKLALGSLEGIVEDISVIPQLTELCEAVQRYGTKIIGQVSCGTGRNAWFDPKGGEVPVSASAIPTFAHPEYNCRALTVDEIKEIMVQFKESARIIKQAGFDAIEVHAHAGYLVDQFMSAVWNKRTDEYGGSLENRARFAIEIVESIREVVGKDYPIIFRIAMEHRFEGGRTMEEGVEIIKLLEKAGVDSFDVDCGSYENIDYIFPPAYLGDACMAYVCNPAKKAVSVPLINAGSHDPESALKLIESGDADFVSFGRPLIADPDMPNKLLNGERDEVRPCIRCNEDCIGRILVRQTKLGCSVNPEAMFEERFSIESSENAKNIVIIGGGPAGMEAARVAALRGNKVTICEKESVLGGQLTSAATPQFKNKLREFEKWQEKQVAKLGVEILLNKEVKEDDPLLAEADTIIVANGATPFVPPIPGMDTDKVIGAIEAHTKRDSVKGDNIVITGGGLTGCDLGLELAMEDGKNVTIIEMGEKLAPGLHFINAISLYNLLNEYKVQQLTSHKVQKITDKGVYVLDAEGNEKVIAADTVITAFGMRPNSTFSDLLEEKFPGKVVCIGDNTGISKVGKAVRTGYYAGISL